MKESRPPRTQDSSPGWTWPGAVQDRTTAPVATATSVMRDGPDGLLPLHGSGVIAIASMLAPGFIARPVTASPAGPAVVV